MTTLSRHTARELANKVGKTIPCAGNLPLDLSDPDHVWLVEEGSVDLSFVEMRDGKEQTHPRPLMRAEAGRLLPNVTPDLQDTSLSLVAKGLPGTSLQQIPLTEIAKLPASELATLASTWILDVSAALCPDFLQQPLPDHLIEAGDAPKILGGTISSRRGVTWLTPPDQSDSAALFMGIIVVEGCDDKGAARSLPLTPDTWILIDPPFLPESGPTTEILAENGQLFCELAEFHKLMFATERMNQMLRVVDQTNLERSSTATRFNDEARERRQLLNLMEGKRHSDVSDYYPLAGALQEIGRREGIEFVWPEKNRTDGPTPTLVDILDVSGVRARTLSIDVVDRWWRAGDGGALLAFLKESHDPVALLPGPFGVYRMVNPKTGKNSRVTARDAESLSGVAWQFYRPLSLTTHKPAELIREFSEGLGLGVARYVIAGLACTILLLSPPIALWFVAVGVIPNGETGLLLVLALGLGAFAFVWALIYLLQGMALLRAESRLMSRIEAAFWDHFLRLPVDFLKQYSAGDRALRGMAFQRLRDTVQGMAANNILSTLFLIPAIAIIFVFDIALGFTAAAFGILALAVTLLLGWRQVSPYSVILNSSHRLAGMLYQLINGIAKLRIDGAEGSAYAVWAQHYSVQKQAEMRFMAWEGRLRAFVSSLPLTAASILFGAAALRGSTTISAADFLLIYTSFMLFMTGIVRLGYSFDAIAAAATELTQIRPILAAAPERVSGKEAVKSLNGDFSLDHVSFQYDPKGPMILNDVSIHARRGEFIAIAGHSGSGKSTLFRLALGLNEPLSGTVNYDGRDLRQLNTWQLRRRIGAVPQAGNLYPQDLWDNITAGLQDVDADDLWAAAREADIADEIKKFPMQMLTCVGDNQNVLSGGELQRITIARALARRPRILFLDEATSFLDNKSQYKVMDRLSKLPITRIVIAHRLSTLREADRIYVLQSGKVVEQGTFHELNSMNGVFSGLVRRQEA